MANETRSLGSAECPVGRCREDAQYRSTKNARVINYRCDTGQHWGNLRIEALGDLGIYRELEFWAEVEENERIKSGLRRRTEKTELDRVLERLGADGYMVG